METTQPVSSESSPEPKLEFERQTCTRCGGSGSYSWCAAYGSKCFLCAGKGKILTKRGAAAAAYWSEIRKRRADTLKPGDVVHMDSITMGGTPFTYWAKVLDVTPGGVEGAYAINAETGERLHPARTDLITVHTKHKVEERSDVVPPEQLYIVRGDITEQRRTLTLAIAYQATLTKTGKPAAPGRKVTPVGEAPDPQKAAERREARRQSVASKQNKTITDGQAAFARPEVKAALGAQPHPLGFNGKTAADYVTYQFNSGARPGQLRAAELVLSTAT
jgi:hypothetical protein